LESSIIRIPGISAGPKQGRSAPGSRQVLFRYVQTPVLHKADAAIGVFTAETPPSSVHLNLPRGHCF
jgi:hypothetical protein